MWRSTAGGPRPSALATSTASCRFSAGSAAACQPGFCWDSQNCSPQCHRDFLGSCRAHCGSHRFVCGFRCFRSQPNLTVSGSGSQIFGQQASSGRRGVQTLETPAKVISKLFGRRDQKYRNKKMLPAARGCGRRSLASRSQRYPLELFAGSLNRGV